MFRLTNINNRSAIEVDGVFHDLAKVVGDDSLADPMNAIARFAELHAAEGEARSGGSPVSGPIGVCVPNPKKVFAIGLNYRSHASESEMEVPPAPLTFTKFPSCLVGPHDDVVLSGPVVDWEVEIVVVMGKGGKDIAEADAWNYVAGITLGQDISDRMVQMTGKPPQFSLGKSFDSFGPIGPVIASVDSFSNPDDIGIWCDVAGQRMQEARTTDLIFNIPFLISYLSSICTLESGDIIFTGTPDGVGAARGQFLKAGDVIDSGAEVIGTLRNVCVEK
jgi:2-keto-4-pentenoate hydratase/2-oxohepta-3-ene-1,7-dioic acid hydratase in catechol pathway